MNVVLGPDVYVNASIARESAPDRVVQRILNGEGPANRGSTTWILERIEAMLEAIPEFKKDAVAPHMATIRSFVHMVETPSSFNAEDWEGALVAAAKAAGAQRVITDHPDLLAKDTVDGVEFISTEAWLLERPMPPPPPGLV